MKYFKKYPLFYILMFLLLAAFAGGVAYDFVLLAERSESDKQLGKAMRAYKKALDDDPTPKAIAASAKNISTLNSRLDFLEKDLTRASGDIFKKQNATEGYQLVEELRGLVNEWRKKAKALDIVVAPDMDFSLKKYVAPGSDPMPKEAVAPIWKQVCVLDYLMGKLFACKSEKSPMSIVNIQREILPTEVVKKKTKNNRRAVNKKNQDAQGLKGDNFTIDEAVTSRNEGLRTIAYRFIFTGHTDVLRRFLNQLKDFDAMLVVRSIDVKPAEKISVQQNPLSPDLNFSLAAAAAAGGSSNANMAFAMPSQDVIDGNAASPQTADAPVVGADGVESQVVSENRTPVVTDNISEFSVVIEYVEVIKDEPKSAKPKTEEAK